MRTRLFFLVCFAAVVAISADNARNGAPRGSSRKNVASGGVTVSPLLRALRPNYPYSVIPGGVYTPDELRQAIAKNPELRQHYAGTDISALRLVNNTAERHAYVSFRANNALFWTTKKLRIAPGEVLLTDGHVFIKTRCGNRLSDNPMVKSGTPSIPVAVLSPPPLTEETVAGVEFTPTPPGLVSPLKGLSPAGFTPLSDLSAFPVAIETGTNAVSPGAPLEETGTAGSEPGTTNIPDGFGPVFKSKSVRVVESKVSPVPEVSTMHTLAIGLIGLLAAGSRKLPSTYRLMTAMTSRLQRTSSS